jgi:leucyl-tRNA synthetase
MAEELWHTVLGRTGSVHQQAWPAYDPALAAGETVTIIVQVDGRLRDRLQVTDGADGAALRALALARPPVQSVLDGRVVSDVIIVPGRLVNIVTAR